MHLSITLVMLVTREIGKVYKDFFLFLFGTGSWAFPDIGKIPLYKKGKIDVRVMVLIGKMLEISSKILPSGYCGCSMPRYASNDPMKYNGVVLPSEFKEELAKNSIL